MPTEYEIDCLRDSLMAPRDVRANRLLTARARDGWELVRFSPMRMLATDIGLYFLFRRVEAPKVPDDGAAG